MKKNPFSIHPIQVCDEVAELNACSTQYILAQVFTFRSLCYRINDPLSWNNQKRIFEFGGELQSAHGELLPFRGTEQNKDGSYLCLNRHKETTVFCIFQGLYAHGETQLFTTDYFQITQVASIYS